MKKRRYVLIASDTFLKRAQQQSRTARLFTPPIPMSEQTVIKGIVNRFHVQRYQEQGGYLSILSDADTLDWDDATESSRYDGCTLILGNGFSENTVKAMLEEFISQSENASEIDWLKQCASKYGIEL